MYHLENVHISSDKNHIDCEFPIQSIVRPTIKISRFRKFEKNRKWCF